MSFDYAEVAADALESLTEFGQNVTHRAYTVGDYDTTTGSVAPTTTDTTRIGVMFDYSEGKTLDGGTLVQGIDKRLLLDVNGTVSPQDHFIVSGVEYVVISVGEIAPAGTVVIYDIHLRK